MQYSYSMEREERIIKAIYLLAEKLNVKTYYVCSHTLSYSASLLRKLEKGSSITREKYQDFKNIFAEHGIDLDAISEE